MILVAIGANLPAADGRDPLTTCRDAAVALDMIPGLHLRGLSPWYESAPQPPSGQPNYINGVAHLHGVMDPAALLRALHAIEARAGRTRGLPNAARTLDLDIIAIGDLVRQTPDLVVPHPRTHERAFVLRPILDIAPAWVHPILKRPVAALLADLPAQDIRQLPATGATGA